MRRITRQDFLRFETVSFVLFASVCNFFTLIIILQANLGEGEEGLNISATFKYPLVSWYPDQELV